MLFNISLDMLTNIYCIRLHAAEDLEAGTRKKIVHAEPTLPIYLKVNKHSYHSNFHSPTLFIVPKNPYLPAVWFEFTCIPRIFLIGKNSAINPHNSCQ